MRDGIDYFYAFNGCNCPDHATGQTGRAIFTATCDIRVYHGKALLLTHLCRRGLALDCNRSQAGINTPEKVRLYFALSLFLKGQGGLCSGPVCNKPHVVKQLSLNPATAHTLMASS